MRKCLVAAVLWAVIPAAIAADEVVFPTSVRLVLAGDGTPSKVEPDLKLPAALQAQLVEQLAGWRFEAVDGQALPSESVTYARLGVCLSPSLQSPDSLDLVIDYRGLGPLAKGGSQQPPSYPVDAARAGYSADMDVSYVVQPDGTATLQEITFVEGGESAASRRAFERAIRDWVAKMRYEPEQRDGQAVVTTIRTPVSFWVGSAGSQQSKRMQAQAAQADAVRRDACATAAAAARDTDSVVLEPRIQRVGSGG